jgi:hypothetical protein
MSDEFLSEPLVPIAPGADPSRMALGEPGLPEAFRWRDREVAITGVFGTWRETGPCHSGSGERYVRKHWFEIATAGEGVWKVYFERQARGGRSTARWWLYSRARDAR